MSDDITPSGAALRRDSPHSVERAAQGGGPRGLRRRGRVHTATAGLARRHGLLPAR